MAYNVECTWDPVSGIDGYNVYLSTDGGNSFTKHNSSLIGTETYTISDIADGDYQAYVVSELGGVESNPSNIESFTVSSVDYFTDFSEYSLGTTTLTDWTDVQSGDSQPYEVISNASAVGGQSLELDNGNPSGYSTLAAPIESGDAVIEIVTQTLNELQVKIRSSLTDGDLTTVYIEIDNGDITVLQRNSGGGGGLIDSTSISVPEHSRIKVDFTTTTIKIKVWEEGTSEPGTWDIDISDSTHNGYTGLGLATSSLNEVDTYSVLKRD